MWTHPLYHRTVAAAQRISGSHIPTTGHATSRKATSENKQGSFKVTAVGPEGRKREAVAFIDSGSSTNAIGENLAKSLKLTGTPVSLGLRTTKSSYSDIDVKTYALTLFDASGRSKEIEAIGIPSSTDSPPLQREVEQRRPISPPRETHPHLEAPTGTPKQDIHRVATT